MALARAGCSWERRVTPHSSPMLVSCGPVTGKQKWLLLWSAGPHSCWLTGAAGSPLGDKHSRELPLSAPPQGCAGGSQDEWK